MRKIELLQKIGGDICDGCGSYADCDRKIDDCARIFHAIQLLDEYVENILAKFSEHPELLF